MADEISHFGHAYGTMLWHHMQALRKGDEPLRERIFQAIEVMREVEPETVAKWEAQFPPDPKPEAGDGADAGA
jgi:hypothetical protein